MNTELCWLCSFFVLIVSVLFTIKPTNFKKPYLWIFEKHNQTSINSGSVFNFICYFQIALGLKNQMVVCLKFITKTPIYVSELISTPFSPFDIKCKILNVENPWKCICRASRAVTFLSQDCTRSWAGELTDTF